VAEPIIKPVSTETKKSDLNGAPVVSIDSHSSFRPIRVSIEDIYHSPDLIGSPYLRNALPLISTALGHIDGALELLHAGDKVGADDEIQHFQVLLPELFGCRSIGEGFGLIVSSFQNAVIRLHGMAMEESQVRAVRSALVGIKSEPFMTFDAAMDHVSRLEHGGLNVDPPKFEYLAELLSE
jgi:hypothetical protein